MMRLGVVSDSHGKKDTMLLLTEKIGKVDAWIHLGDFAEDSKHLHGAPVYAIKGNCDFTSKYELEQVLTFEQVRIFITHGNKYSPTYDRSMLSYKAEELNCQVALYGHTHISSVEFCGGVLVVNPGSPTSPRGGQRPSAAVLEINGKDAYASIVVL